MSNAIWQPAGPPGTVRVYKLAEFEMLDELEQLTLDDAKELTMWSCAWYDQAIAMNFVGPSYHPDIMMIERLRRYFHAGFSPAEAAQACFGGKH